MTLHVLSFHSAHILKYEHTMPNLNTNIFTITDIQIS